VATQDTQEPDEGNLGRLQQRCRRQGTDEGAIALLGKVPASGVGLEGLTRPLTDEEVEAEESGIRTGQVYNTFLKCATKGECLTPRYVCRLCQSGLTWKHSKDVEMKRHPCK
jgi:hypothetical protein